jgi:hypothetical protein
MVRYCALTCGGKLFRLKIAIILGFCAAGSIGRPGLIPNYNPINYPIYHPPANPPNIGNGVIYYPNGGYYYPNQQVNK